MFIDDPPYVTESGPNTFTIGSTNRDDSFAVQCESTSAAGTLYTTSVLNVYGVLLNLISVLNVCGMLLYAKSVLNVYGKEVSRTFITCNKSSGSISQQRLCSDSV